MPDFRRGASEIAKAQEKSKGGGKFKPFTPSLFWKGDGDSKYLLFLNPVSDIPTVEMINFIPVKNKKANGDEYTTYEQVISRTDPVIGERTDPMAQEWDGKPKDTCVAVAVELEPTFTEIKGRKRPSGFEVKTTTFERRVRDEDGELTDETEEVESPAIGFITQSPHNFFNVVTSYDAGEAPIEETPVKITRVGSDNSTVYTVDGYPDQEIDLSGLIECVSGISYLGEDADDIIEQIDGAEDIEAAGIIGAFMLDKRLEELVDEDRYNDLFDGITASLDRFGSKKKKGAATAKKERPARRSQRRSAEPEADEPETQDEPEAEAEEKPARRKRTAAPKADAKPGKQGDEAALDKLAELRARTKRKASAAA